jgi:hypothetical protein
MWYSNGVHLTILVLCQFSMPLIPKIKTFVYPFRDLGLIGLPLSKLYQNLLTGNRTDHIMIKL